jgi:hypothetical protein
MTFEDEFAYRVAAVRSAMDDLGPQVKGMSQERAEAHLRGGFRDRGIRVTTGEVRTFALVARDRFWTFKHPLKARALFREWRQPSDPL